MLFRNIFILRKTFCGMIKYIDNLQENILFWTGSFANKVSIIKVVQIGWRRIIKSEHHIKEMICFSAISGFLCANLMVNYLNFDV